MFNVVKFSFLSIIFMISACGLSNRLTDVKANDVRSAVDERDITKLLSFLGDNQDINELVLNGIGNIQPAEFPESALKFLSSGSEKVRAASGFAVGQCFQSKPFPEKIEANMLELLEREKSKEVRIAFLNALGLGASRKALEMVSDMVFSDWETAVGQGMAFANFFMRGIASEKSVNKCVELAYLLVDKKVSFLSPFYAISRVQDSKLLHPHLDTLVRFFDPKKPSEARMFLASAFANLLSPDGFSICYRLAQDKDPAVAIAAIQGLRPYTQVPEIKEHLVNLIVSLFKSNVYHVVKNAVELSSSLQRDSVAKLALMPALAGLLSSPSLDIRAEVIKPLVLSDFSNATYQKALAEINEGKKIVPKMFKLDTTFLRRPVDWERFKTYSGTVKAVIETTKGKIHVDLFADETPFTVQNFIELSKQHYYDNTLFHRVVSNFVVQGGDPQGNGMGGPGYTIRSEFTSRFFLRGVLGMASSGKDTEGSQFFIMTASQPHLNGRYTPFGKVTSGMDVADKLEVWDKILSVKIK